MSKIEVTAVDDNTASQTEGGVVMMSTQILEQDSKDSIKEEAKRVLQKIDDDGEMSFKDNENEDEEEEDDEEDEDEVISYKDEHLIWNPGSGQRHWLKTRGKSKFIDFEDDQRNKLKTYFRSLDDDDSGSIGVDELEEPLIALGLLDSRQQVQNIVETVDDDGSGMLEFEEFLKIINSGQKKGGDHAHPAGNGQKQDNKDAEASGAIYQFFKGLTSGKLKGGGNPNVPFSLYISQERRRRLLQSMGVPALNNEWSLQPEEMKAGEKIAQNYKRQIAERLTREHLESEGWDPKSMMSGRGSPESKGGKSKGTATMNSTGYSSKRGDTEISKVISSKLQEVSQFQGEPPDAETKLAAIFYGRPDKKFDLGHEMD